MSFGSFDLIPYRRGEESGGGDNGLQGVLDSVLMPYVERGGSMIDACTLLRVRDKHILEDLTQDESNAIFSFSELLALSGLSKREYFGMTVFLYCNRDLFRITIQSFKDPGGGATRQTRRRDGFTTNYVTRDAFRIYRPDYLSSPFRVDIDSFLLNSLIKAQQDLASEKWEAVFESITNFNAANTDSPYVSVQAELVALNGAFERLFDLRSGRENDLAQAFTASLSPEVDLAPAECARLSAPSVSSRLRGCSTIREMWIRDFFRLRGNLAHGQIEAGYPSVWNIHDHLLLGSFVFPLVLKRKLRDEGIYEMEWKDFAFESAFERLACEDHCIERDEDAEWPWNKVISDVVFEYALREQWPGTPSPD